MIYRINQVSNVDTQILYFYRILRHSATELSSLFRYSDPEVFTLESYQTSEIDGNSYYEYRLATEVKSNRIPYLEFNSTSEQELLNVRDLTEIEVTTDGIIIRGNTDGLTAATTVSVYWVPSLSYIRKMQDEIENLLDKLKKQHNSLDDKINNISIDSDYVIDANGLVPNLVNIGTDVTGLIYSDSGYKLSGSLMPQIITNPAQSVISSLLKSHTGTLIFNDLVKDSKVYQGFYGGIIRLTGNFNTLVLKDITSIVYMTGITADKLIIENCPAVILRESLEVEGSSGDIGTLEIRNTYLTVYQVVSIDTLRCTNRSTWVQKKGTIGSVGFVEAGSTLVYDTPSEDNQINSIRASALQGLFYTNNPTPELPYLEEIFLAQKPISFQRGQIEDPLPIPEAEVTIYIKHTDSDTPTPGPSPTPGGKPYSPYSDWYWSGDSRVVQMIAATGTDGKGYGGEALEKLIEVQTEIETQGAQHNIILWWGVNGLDSGASAYADVYKRIANNTQNTAKVFVGTVGHCPNGSGSGKVDGGAGQSLVPFNEKISKFNQDLKGALANESNIYVLDVDAYIQQLEKDKGAAWLTSDNLHYLPDASKAIYAWVCDQITNITGVQVDTKYTPFDEYINVDLSDSYMGVLPTTATIEQNVGLGIMYGISMGEYGNNPVGWLYARIFRTYLMLGYYKKFSHNLTEEGRALLHPETSAWSFSRFYSEEGLLQTVRDQGTQEGLENFYYMLKLGNVLTGYTEDMDDFDKMRIIAGGAPTGNNSNIGCPQDGQFHENVYKAGVADALWAYDSPSSWIPYGTGRMTYYSERWTASGSTINPNI